jgi:hypothetical protein
MARKPPDQSRRHARIVRKLLRDIGRKLLDRYRKRAQRVEADHFARVAQGDEDARDIPPFILSGSSLKPVIELGAPRSERASIMPRRQRLDRKGVLAQPNTSR